LSGALWVTCSQEFEKMGSETFVAGLERLLSTRLGLVVKHRPVIQLLCEAMSEAGFALELLGEIKALSDAKIHDILGQYHLRHIIIRTGILN
jgi:hypothetical protein